MKYYRPRVYRFIVLFTKNEDSAEDLTQDVMFKVWSHRAQLQNLADIDNYILKMAKHHVIEHFKKMAREKAYQEEIATTLDIAPRTAINHLDRAMKVIRSQLNPDSFLFWLMLVGSGLFILCH